MINHPKRPKNIMQTGNFARGLGMAKAKGKGQGRGKGSMRAISPQVEEESHVPAPKNIRHDEKR